MIIMEDPYNFCGHRQKTGEKSSIDKEDLYQMIYSLKKEGLDFDEISSALNLGKRTVKRLYKLVKKTNNKSKIDHDTFVKMWKKGLPYEVIANYFGVKEETAQQYKSRKCKGITRMVLCQKCGATFETDSYRRANCDKCSQMMTEKYFRKKRWREKLENGTKIIMERNEKRYEEEIRRLQKGWGRMAISRRNKNGKNTK